MYSALKNNHYLREIKNVFFIYFVQVIQTVKNNTHKRMQAHVIQKQ